jgi:hypothetical protein
LSPQLWRLVVDEFLRKLSEGDYYTAGYAGDTAILIIGKLPETGQICYKLLWE